MLGKIHIVALKQRLSVEVAVCCHRRIYAESRFAIFYAWSRELHYEGGSGIIWFQMFCKRLDDWFGVDFGLVNHL